jgi:hypothetical protein
LLKKVEKLDIMIKQLQGAGFSAEAAEAAAGNLPSADSREAMVARAKQIVELLSTCLVREGWKLDAERAAQFLESVRDFDGNDGDCRKFTMVRDWLYDHGQSLDWLHNGDVSSLIVGEAAMRGAASAPPSAKLRPKLVVLADLPADDGAA